MSGSTGGKVCPNCGQGPNGQHDASCPNSSESVERRRREREGK